MAPRSTPCPRIWLRLRWFAPLACALAGCGGPDSSSSASAVRFDPCAALVLVADDDMPASATVGVVAGLASWNTVANARLALERGPVAVAVAGGSRLPIHFQAAGAPFHGLYDPDRAEIFINTDLAGHAQSVAVAHEVGHAFGLGHVSIDERRSVMNAGNLDQEPSSEDAAALADLWGRRCPGADQAAAAGSG